MIHSLNEDLFLEKNKSIKDNDSLYLIKSTPKNSGPNLFSCT